MKLSRPNYTHPTKRWAFEHHIYPRISPRSRPESPWSLLTSTQPLMSAGFQPEVYDLDKARVAKLPLDTINI